MKAYPADRNQVEANPNFVKEPVCVCAYPAHDTTADEAQVSGRPRCALQGGIGSTRATADTIPGTANAASQQPNCNTAQIVSRRCLPSKYPRLHSDWFAEGNAGQFVVSGARWAAISEH